MQTTLYAIVGNIGSGKTTAFESVKELVKKRNPNQKLVFLDEGVSNTWNEYMENGETLLSLFYKYPEKYALKMQLMATSEKIRQITKAIEENPGATIICERTHYCSYHVFRKLIADKMTECEMKLYESVFDSYPNIEIDKIFYIDTPPQECAKRIEIRGRPEEEGVSLEYLTECDRLHHNWLDTCNNVIRLPFEQSIDVLKDQWYNMIINQPARELVYLSGKKSAGKTESAKFLVSKFGYREFAYADILKEIGIMFGYSPELFYDKKEVPCEEMMGHRPREFLQKLGSVLRSEMRPFTRSGNIIIDALNKKIEKFKGNVVVSDARFPSEVSDKGLVIKIERPGLKSTDMDVTETSVDQIQGDITLLNDYTVVALRQCLAEIINSKSANTTIIRASKMRCDRPPPIMIEPSSPTSKYGSLEGGMLIFGERDAYPYLDDLNPNVVISINGKRDNYEPYGHSNSNIKNHVFLADDRCNDLIPLFPKISELINGYLNKDKKVFVHCRMGISMSCACIIHFLKNYRNMSYEQARALVSDARLESYPCMSYVLELNEKLRAFITDLSYWEFFYEKVPLEKREEITFEREETTFEREETTFEREDTTFEREDTTFEREETTLEME